MINFYVQMVGIGKNGGYEKEGKALIKSSPYYFGIHCAVTLFNRFLPLVRPLIVSSKTLQ